MAVFSVKVIAPAPDCVRPPVSVMLPPAVRFKVPEPTEEVPSTKAEPLLRATLFAPLLFRDTAPVKALLWVRVMPKAPVVKLEVPGTVKMPD